MTDIKSSLYNLISHPVVLAVLILVVVIVAVLYIHEYIKRRNESIRRINMMVNLDDLTHLYKRKFFFSMFESELERARRHQRKLSASIIEIDNYNGLKDKYGEKFCNLVVQDIGEIFTDDTRIHDICARYGDYSFASLMPESDLQAAILVCRRLRGSIENCKFSIDGSNKIIRVTVSIGVVSCDEYLDNEEVTYKDILKKANEALVIAKEKGGNRVESYQAGKEAV